MEVIAYILTSVIGMLFTVGATYGIVQTKLTGIKEELLRLETEVLDLRETCIRKDYLHAITDPLQRHIQDIQTDIKEILRRLSK